MDITRFDALTKTLTQTFASRRSRRAAVRGGGLGLAAAAHGLAGRRRAAAQDATPTAAAADPATDAEKTTFLFVQVFEAGTLVPKPGEDGVYTLTLSGGPEQTVYFSDRPERIVGMVPTHAFLDGLGFSPADPPKAALVAQTSTGADVVVLELFNPVYTESFGGEGGVTLTYDVQVLADYAGEGLAHLAAQQEDADMPEAFGAASLFIDDCADQEIHCHSTVADFGATLGKRGFCWQFGYIYCEPCRDYAPDCNAAFPECQGHCETSYLCAPPGCV